MIQLTRRTRLSATLTARTGLHPGRGEAPLGRPLPRDADGHPFLPGSALRGSLRATLEALLGGVDDRDRGLYADPDDPEAPVTRLFGGLGQPGAVRLTDAWILDRAAAPCVAHRETRRIDPATGAAIPGAATRFETIPPGARFGLELFADNLADWELGLLLCAFDQLHHGFATVGGLTARGLGWIQLEWTDLIDLEPRELLYTGGALPAGAHPDLPATLDRWRAALADHLGSR